jgi:hypothetical protein
MTPHALEETTQNLLSGLKSVIGRAVTEYGTDGQSIDLGWWCFTPHEARTTQHVATAWLTWLGLIVTAAGPTEYPATDTKTIAEDTIDA